MTFGADPNEISESGELPLIEAVKRQYYPGILEALKLLIKAGEDPLRKNSEGKSALDEANEGLKVTYASFNEYVADLEKEQEADKARRAAAEKEAAQKRRAAPQVRPNDDRPNVALSVYQIIAGEEVYLNAHEILGIASDASQEEVKNAYRRVAVKWHPDKNPDPDAGDAFKLISWAYEKEIAKSRAAKAAVQPDAAKQTAQHAASEEVSQSAIKPATRPAEPRLALILAAKPAHKAEQKTEQLSLAMLKKEIAEARVRVQAAEQAAAQASRVLEQLKKAAQKESETTKKKVVE